jgi:type II secretion system protein N
VGNFRRIALSIIGALFALVATTLIGLNLYVQSQGTQARIQQELSQRIGTALQIRRISVTPWGGLTLTGITVPQISTASSSNFLEAKSFHLHLRLLSLFSKRLVIKEVSLLAPNVVWPQNGDGKWRLPGSRDEKHPAPPPVEGAAVSASPSETVAAMPLAPTPNIANTNFKAGKTNIGFVPEVRRVNVTGGSFRFLDRSGTMIAFFEGVDFHSSLRNAQDLRGNAKIAKISLRDRFFLERLQSPLRYDPKVLDLAKISAHAGGGEINGQFAMEPQSEDTPFKVSMTFQNIQADQIVADAGGPKGMVQGKLEGSFAAAGKTGDANALAGAGQIFLRDGQLQQYSLLVALGQVLQIEELTQLHLEQAQAKYHISSGLVTIDELTLRSQNIRLSATGTVTFSGKLRLDSQLAINEKIRGQLFKPIRENFRPISEAGYSAVDFQVAGTIDRPKSNLMERMVGRDLKDFVSGFFGGKKSERPKNKKPADAARQPEQATPTPAPAATSDPISPAVTATPSPP